MIFIFVFNQMHEKKKKVILNHQKKTPSTSFRYFPNDLKFYGKSEESLSFSSMIGILLEVSGGFEASGDPWESSKWFWILNHS